MNTVPELHSLWNALTGQQLHERAFERRWFEFGKLFTGDDLITVVRYMKFRNKQMDGAQYSFNAHRVVGDLERFASILAEAKAIHRNRRKPETDKDRVLKMTGRPDTHREKLPRSVFEVLKAVVEQQRPSV
jgi:hypothetical protein